MGTIWEQLIIFVPNQLASTYESFRISQKDSKEE
jgi:hypothetical protein